MAETQWQEVQWEKDAVQAADKRLRLRANSGRWKYLLVGVAILAVAAYLIFSSTLIGARYYMTVDELMAEGDMVGKSARVSGAVDGDPVFDPATGELSFVVANIPNTNDEIKAQGGLALVLYNAVNDPSATRLKVVAYDTEIPDLLQHEAQAIMSGKLTEMDGEIVFVADEIMLKCPTKYEEDVPAQAAN